MARRFTVLNHKGGVGKSTTACTLAVALAQRGHRTLLIDYDGSESGSTQFLGLTKRAAEQGVYGSSDLTLQKSPFSPQANHLVKGLDVVLATEELQFLERELLTNVVSGVRSLSNALRPLDSKYDYIIIDCGHGQLGMLVNSAMAACPNLIVPVLLEPASLRSAHRLRGYVERNRIEVEPSINIFGVLGTFYRDNEAIPKETLVLLREIFGETVFETVIPRATAVSRAAQMGAPVVLTEPSHKASEAYGRLTEEIVRRSNSLLNEKGVLRG